MFKSDYNANEKVLTCTFAGHLDTNSCINLNVEVNARIESIKGPDPANELADTKIIFDLKDVSYLASSFIRICVGAAKQFPKDHFVILNCDPFTKKTFIIAGLDDVLKVS
jgi:anti-anti-sigma factor